MTNLLMNSIRQINRSTTLRQNLNITLRSKNMNLKQFLFKSIHKLLWIFRILLPFQSLTKPSKLILFYNNSLLLSLITLLFISPVRSNTKLSNPMHLPSSNLNLKRSTLRTYQSSMYRLIHILLRYRNIILKTTWHWII